MKYFPRIFVIADSSRDPTRFQKKEFTDHIMFMSMFSDIDWTKRENGKICIPNAEKVKDYSVRFLPGHWTFLGPGSGKKWYGESSYSPNGEQNSTANKKVQRLKETGHLVFKSTSALSRGILRRKKGEENHTLQWRFIV